MRARSGSNLQRRHTDRRRHHHSNPRRRHDATIDSLEATPSYDNPTLVEGECIGSRSVEADGIKDGKTGRCSIWFGSSFGTPSVDVASDNPTVIWD